MRVNYELRQLVIVEMKKKKKRNGQCHLSSKHTIFARFVLNILNKQKSDIPDLNRRISEQKERLLSFKQ